MAKISKDLSAGNLHPRETLFTAGNLGALNAEIVTACDGSNSLALDLRGTFSMTIEVSGTVDGTNWTLIPVRPINLAGLQYVTAVVGTAAVPAVLGPCHSSMVTKPRCGRASPSLESRV